MSSRVWAFVVSLFCLPMLSRSPSIKPNAHPQNEEHCPVAIHNPLTGYEPNQLDNFDYSETSAAIFQDESVDMDTGPSYSFGAELDDELIGKALSSPLFIQEPEINLSLWWGKFVASSVLSTRTGTGRPENEPSSDLSQKRKSSRESENERWSQIWDPEARTSSRVW